MTSSTPAMPLDTATESPVHWRNPLTGNLFWPLQVMGWLGLSIITYLSLSLPYNQFELSYLAHNATQSLLGIVLTLPLRYCYQRIWHWPVWRRVVVAVAAALLLSALWAVMRLVIFMALTGETGLWPDFGRLAVSLHLRFCDVGRAVPRYQVLPAASAAAANVTRV